MKKKTSASASSDVDESSCMDALWAKFADSFDKYSDTQPYTHILKKIGRDNLLDCPNLLLYSAPGFPLDLVWTSLIQRLFQIKLNSTEKIYDKEVVYSESPHHFLIDMALPHQSASLAKLTGFIKDIIMHRCIDQGCRHVMVISSFEKLLNSESDSSRAFRVLLEKYSSNVFFICTTTAISSIEKPLQSRFLGIRVPAFTNDQINNILTDISLPQLMNIERHACNRNIAFCIYMSYLLKTGRDVDNIRYPMIREVLVNAVPSLDSIRNLAAQLHGYNASLADVANDLMILWCSKQTEILDIAASIDHINAQTDGNRKSLYIEYLLTAVVNLVET